MIKTYKEAIDSLFKIETINDYSLDKIIKLNLTLSYFEKCVLIAFEFFKLHKCEYVILEVWVWWKLDTTNIVNPIITTITSIWYDHQLLLWNTLEKISEQKAWIIKKSIPVVLNIKNTPWKKFPWIEIIEKKALKENLKNKFDEIFYCFSIKKCAIKQAPLRWKK